MIKPVVLTIGPVAGFNKGDEVPQEWIDRNLNQAILLPLRSVVTIENALNMLIEVQNGLVAMVVAGGGVIPDKWREVQDPDVT